MAKGYAVTTGELRESLLAEMSTLRSGRSDTDRAKEVVRLANSVNEILRTELSIKKAEIELGTLAFGEQYIANPKTKHSE